MKGVLTIVLLMSLVGLATAAGATPSTTYWTPCTLDFQPPNLTHLTYDTYNDPGNPAADTVSAFPTDYGLTWGKAFKGGLALEYGFDYFAPAANPLFFNAKIGYPEKMLSPAAPAFEAGIFNAGTKSRVTNQDILYLLVGRSLPHNLGRLSAAWYSGNATALGGTEHTGYMVAYDRVLIKDKVVFAADYASGKNAIGGGGAGLYYYFTPNIDLLAGPVWFNDRVINGKTKFTLQCDINF